MVTPCDIAWTSMSAWVRAPMSQLILGLSSVSPGGAIHILQSSAYCGGRVSIAFTTFVFIIFFFALSLALYCCLRTFAETANGNPLRMDARTHNSTGDGGPVSIQFCRDSAGILKIPDIRKARTLRFSKVRVWESL